MDTRAWPDWIRSPTTGTLILSAIHSYPMRLQPAMNLAEDEHDYAVVS